MGGVETPLMITTNDQYYSLIIVHHHRRILFRQRLDCFPVAVDTLIPHSRLRHHGWSWLRTASGGKPLRKHRISLLVVFKPILHTTRNENSSSKNGHKQCVSVDICIVCVTAFRLLLLRPNTNYACIILYIYIQTCMYMYTVYI